MADKNEPPQIPSFKPAKKEDKKGGALSSLGKPSGGVPSATPPSSGMKWPSLGGPGGAPKLKVRGLPGGATILDRLKNLRRKDMGFIAAGLSVLMMAPVAEHLMMSPEDKKGGDLTAGFDQKGPLFPDGTTIYENGTGGFSPGSLVGSGTDVITPLNVRDPAALVMGPGATQKPAATVTPPAAPPEKSNWKDALSQAAGRGAKKAVSKAKLPKPNVKMSGALRGLSSLSGASRGGGPSMKLEAPSAGNVPNRARGSDSLSRVQSVPGLRGVGRRSNASSGSPESLRNAGARAGNLFNSGGAASALDAAAAQGIPSGGGGFGGGGPSDSKAGKGPGGNNSKGQRSVGESLAFLRAKKEQDKAIDLKWKMKEWETFGKKKMIEEAVIKSAVDNLLGKGIFEPMGKAIADMVGLMDPDGVTKGAVCTSGGKSVTFKNTSNQIFFCAGEGEKHVWTQIKSKEGQTDRKPYQTCEACGAITGSPGPTNNTPGTGDSGSPQNVSSGHSGNSEGPRTGTAGAVNDSVVATNNWGASIASLGTAHTKLNDEIGAAEKDGKLQDDLGKALAVEGRKLATMMANLKLEHEKAKGHVDSGNKLIVEADAKMRVIMEKLGGKDGAGNRMSVVNQVLADGKSAIDSMKVLADEAKDFDNWKGKFGTTEVRAKYDSALKKATEIDGVKESSDRKTILEALDNAGKKDNKGSEIGKAEGMLNRNTGALTGSIIDKTGEFRTQMGTVISAGDAAARGNAKAWFNLREIITSGENALSQANLHGADAVGKARKSYEVAEAARKLVEVADTAMVDGEVKDYRITVDGKSSTIKANTEPGAKGLVGTIDDISLPEEDSSPSQPLGYLIKAAYENAANAEKVYAVTGVDEKAKILAFDTAKVSIDDAHKRIEELGKKDDGEIAKKLAKPLAEARKKLGMNKN